MRDVHTESHVSHNAEIVVYYLWLTRTSLSADRDVMGVAWVVRDLLWNASCAPWDCRQVLAESWAHRTLEAASIDMDYAPPLLAAQVYYVCNTHWVLRMLLDSPMCTFLCLVFDLLCNRPCTVGANTEELTIVNLSAEQDGVEPRPKKKWGTFLGEFGSVVLAIAPLYSTFLRQRDGVSRHLAYLLMMQLAQDRMWLSREIAQTALHFRNSAHASPIQTTPSWALARMYARPYCPASRSSCFFLR